MNINGVLRFHSNHARNVVLEENGLVAHRIHGFGDGIVFSERYLHPGEFFVVEIDQREDVWMGYLRLGLTQINPSDYSSTEYSSDDLAWMFALTDLLSSFSVPEDIRWPRDIDTNKIDVSEDYITTCYGSYLRLDLNWTDDKGSTCSNQDMTFNENLEVGFRVGVVYIPSDEKFADLYYVINGNVFGPYAIEIPYKQSPLFAVADVFGNTKKIRVLPLRLERSLKQLCRTTILKTYNEEELKKLPLPRSILDYLNFNSVTSIS